MSDAALQALLSAFRTLLGFGAGLLVARGVINETQALELVGAIMVIIPLGWGVYQKFQAEASAKDRETVAVQAGAEAKARGALRTSADITPARAQTIIKTMVP